MKHTLFSLVCCLPLLFNASSIQSLEIVGPDLDTQIVIEEQYGPIQTTATLWSVSTDIRPDNSVSVYQTLVAIYKLNPNAFFEGDINKIISGSIITVPSKEFIEQQTNREALALLKPATKKATNNSSIVKNTPIQSTIAKPVVQSIEKKSNVETVAVEKVKKVEEIESITKSDKPQDVITAEPAVALKKKVIDQITDTQVKTESMEKALIKARKLIAEQEIELNALNEQLLNVTEMNQRLKIKIQPLADQITLLGEQIKEEESLQSQLQILIDEYREQIDSHVKPPFSGDGFFNGILQAITSSITALLLTIISPMLLLIGLFVMIMRIKSKREIALQEQEMAESTATLMEQSGKFDDLLTDNLDDEDDDLDFTSDSNNSDTVENNVNEAASSSEVNEPTIVNDVNEPTVIVETETGNEEIELDIVDESEQPDPVEIPEDAPFEEAIGTEDDPFGIGALSEEEDIFSTDGEDSNEIDIEALISGEEETIELSDTDIPTEDEATQEDLDLAAEWESQLASEADDAAELIVSEASPETEAINDVKPESSVEQEVNVETTLATADETVTPNESDTETEVPEAIVDVVESDVEIAEPTEDEVQDSIEQSNELEAAAIDEVAESDTEITESIEGEIQDSIEESNNVETPVEIDDIAESDTEIEVPEAIGDIVESDVEIVEPTEDKVQDSIEEANDLEAAAIDEVAESDTEAEVPETIVDVIESDVEIAEPTEDKVQDSIEQSNDLEAAAIDEVAESDTETEVPEAIVDVVESYVEIAEPTEDEVQDSIEQSTDLEAPAAIDDVAEIDVPEAIIDVVESEVEIAEPTEDGIQGSIEESNDLEAPAAIDEASESDVEIADPTEDEVQDSIEEANDLEAPAAIDEASESDTETEVPEAIGDFVESDVEIAEPTEVPEVIVDVVESSTEIAEPIESDIQNSVEVPVTESVEQTEEKIESSTIDEANEIIDVDNLTLEDADDNSTEDKISSKSKEQLESENIVEDIESTFGAEFTNNVEEYNESLSETKLTNQAENDIDTLSEIELSSDSVDDVDELSEIKLSNAIQNELETSSNIEDESGDEISSEEQVTSEDEANFEAVFQNQLANAAKHDLFETEIPSESLENFPLDESVRNEQDFDLSEFENFDISNLKSVDESISALDAGEELSDHDALAKQLSDVAFNEDVPLPTIDKDNNGFIDINTLLENNDVIEIDEDFNLDLNLDEFPDVVESFSEFDIDEGGIAAKLDLARAYLEIDEINGATEILTSLLDTAKDAQLKEVKKLFAKIK